VVVGEEEALCADDLAGAAAAEDDDGVLDGGLVDVVELVFGEFETAFDHVVVHLLPEEHGQPHAFVGRGQQAGQGEG
jgi:hypothetical protein